MRRATLGACVLLPLMALSLYIYTEHERGLKLKALMRADDQRLMQQVIHDYTVHEGKPPKSLDDLVIKGYLKAIPWSDPMYFDPVTPPPTGRPQLISVPAT
jgi:hypothetical protein